MDASTKSLSQNTIARPKTEHATDTRASSPNPRALKFGSYVRSRSKLIANQTAALTAKVADLWTGTAKHYDEDEQILPNTLLGDVVELDLAAAAHGDNFRNHFALPAAEKLRASYFAYLHRGLPLYGKVYVGNTFLCFRSLIPCVNTKLILPLLDIENVQPATGFHFGYAGLVVIVKAHEELFIEFSQRVFRDDCMVSLLKLKELCLSPTPYVDTKGLGIKDIPAMQVMGRTAKGRLNFVCLTIGSRGDVQPYIALCKGLMAEGHDARIATHAEFGSWIEGHGVSFAAIEGDPTELMRICVEHGMFTLSFLREASSKFRGWIDGLLNSAWEACQGADVLIESPSAMAGLHIAESLQIPYFQAFSMPWTRTRAFPHAFAATDNHRGGTYNYMSYVLFEHVFWNAIAGQINGWRQNILRLPSTDLVRMKMHEVPFLYNFSPQVVSPPLDYSEQTKITGYWFLDEAVGWQPPQEMTDFIAQARLDKKKLVYIGFGSIVVADSAALTAAIVAAAAKADVRVILSKGWSDRLIKTDTTDLLDIPFILCIKAAPHDWLFRQLDAAVHHGGSGTTGASLRAGLPTIVKPFFGDQFFFGTRVEDLGVGIQLKNLNIGSLSWALWRSTHDERMIKRAQALGQAIRAENGVQVAVSTIIGALSNVQLPISPLDEDAWTMVDPSCYHSSAVTPGNSPPISAEDLDPLGA